MARTRPPPNCNWGQILIYEFLLSAIGVKVRFMGFDFTQVCHFLGRKGILEPLGRWFSWLGLAHVCLSYGPESLHFSSLGALALWSGSEAVLPAYLMGMVLAEFSTGGHLLHAPSADSDGRISYTILFPSCRNSSIPARPGFRPNGFSGLVVRRGDIENFRTVSFYRTCPSPA